MKLIIDIPEYEYQRIKEIYEKNDTVEATYSYIYHGTPLKQELILEHVEKVQENLNSMVEQMDNDTDYYDSIYHLEQIKEKIEQEPKTELGGERMIQINDNDLPITVAEKIICGKKPYNPNEIIKAVSKAITGEEKTEQNMFELEEIKEIADYLMCYYNNHPNGD